MITRALALLTALVLAMGVAAAPHAWIVTVWSVSLPFHRM